MPGKIQAIEKIAKEMTWWKAVDLTTRETVRFVKSTESLGVTPFEHSDYQYIETSKGERFFSSIHHLTDGGRRKQECYFDGRRGVTIHYREADPSRQQSVAITHAFADEAEVGGTERPAPLKLLYVDKAPLYAALDRARFLGVESGPHGACEKYLFENVKMAKVEQTLCYYLDEKTALPTRVDSFDRPDPATGRRYWSWEARSIDSIDGHPFVTASVNTAYERGPGSDGKSVWYTNTYETKAVRFNVVYPKNRFSPVIQRGAIVHDELTKKTTLPPREAQSSVGGAVASVATPPPDWTSYASYTSYGVGAVLLVACVALRARGR